MGSAGKVNIGFFFVADDPKFAGSADCTSGASLAFECAAVDCASAAICEEKGPCGALLPGCLLEPGRG